MSRGLLLDERTAICTECKEPFQTRASNALVCSPTCRRARERAQERARQQKRRAELEEPEEPEERYQEYYSSTLTDAERIALGRPIPKPGRIQCLRCNRWFDSKDTINNRICKSCKSHNVMAYDPIVEGW